MFSLLLKKMFPSLLLLLFLAANNVVCQHVIRFNMPKSMCEGDSLLITIGYDTSNSIVVASETSLGHSDRIFLPDGISCGEMGCSYVSPVTFSAFPENDTISSVEDINFVRVNIEHSYIGDLYINIKCPNNQKADLMRFSNFGSSDCVSAIPSFSRGWLSGNNMEPGTNLGNCVGTQDRDNPCDSGTLGNRAGYGWNYCWSNNTTNGYQYASGDGIIYRDGHVHNNKVDSSFLAARVDFYHPDENFSSLIGCPLNGEWKIEVVDGYHQDNGYLFGWEISLNAELLAQCVLDSFVVEGNMVTRINDTCFLLCAPTDLDADTRWMYHLRGFDTCGNVEDTAFFLMIYRNWEDEETQEVVENDLPIIFCEQSFYNGIEDTLFRLSSRYGCDSLVHYSLKVWHNVENVYDTVVCETDIPLQWRGVEFVGSDSSISHFYTVHGADSTVILVLHTLPQDTIDVRQGICDGRSYTWIDGISYSDTSLHPVITLSSSGVCDSVLRLLLSISETPFQAALTVTPNPVQSDNLTCTAVDLSDSRRREWSILDFVDTARRVVFVYPIEYDSVEVFMTAYDKNGCSDAVSTVVRLDKTVFWAPNVFTPDEQSNRLFFVPSEGVLRGEVQIFDRSGGHIATFDLQTGSWDGTKNGRKCPQGAYVWHIVYVSSSQPQIEKQAVGTVTLLR